VGTTPLLSLAESLSSLRPTINGYIQELRDDYQETEANRAYDTIQGMTYEQSAQAVNDGTMRKTESPWYRAAFQKQFGLAHAAQRKREIVTAYNNEFDKENGDIGEFLTRYVQEDYEQYGDSEFIKAGLREGMAGVFDSIKDTQAQYVDTNLQQRTSEQFYTLAGSTVETALTDGSDVNAALARLSGDHGTSLGLQPEEMDTQLLLLAEGYAEKGDLKAVESILNADPHGLGSLSSRSTFAAKAAGLTESAAAKSGELNRTANTMTVVDLQDRAAKGLLDDADKVQIKAFQEDKQFSQREVESLLGSNDEAQKRAVGDAFESRLQSDALTQTTDLLKTGRIYTLQDQVVTNPYNGKSITIKADELERMAVNEQMNAMAAKNATPQVMAAQMATWGTSVKFSVWEDAMSDGYTAVSTQMATIGPDGMTAVPEPAKAGYALWRSLEGQPSLRDRHVTDGTAAQLYRDAELLEEHGVMTADEALLAAARIDRKSSRSSLASSIDRDKFASAVREVTKGGFFSDAAANQGDANIALEGLARIYIDLGIPAEKAVTRAAEDVNRTYTVVGGVLVNTRDKFIPPDFGNIAQVALESFVEANPTVDIDDIRLWPVDGQDSWIITDEYFRPVPGAKAIHISQLQKNPKAYGIKDANEAITKNQ
jgi:hypothetical protein